MTIDLPLARGHLDALPDVRDSLDPRRVALGEQPLPGSWRVAVHALDEHGDLALSGGSLLVIDEGGAPAVRGAREVSLVGGTPDGVMHLAAVLADHGDLPGAEWQPLRSCGHLLGDDEAGVATAAVALWNWHRTATHCVRCGHAVEPAEAGWATRCPGCGNMEYPRQDPAVIMAVIDSRDRLLMAHNAAWPAGRWSVLAGFVEAGEAPERTVRREVMEETGLRVADVRYRGSQPWPFPRSLMLAYTATLAQDGEPHPDGEEIEEARFLSREELRDAILSGEIAAPPKSTIARSLIDDWYGPGLPDGA